MRERVVVAGAGIVGVCCALYLQRDGRRVTLLDAGAPGGGASSGNACTIAVHGCIPINRPQLPLRLPALLFGAHRPLRIAPLYALRRAHWLLQFLRHCTSREVAKISAALAALLSRAHDGYAPLIKTANCAHLLRQNGCLYVYASERDFARDAADMQTRRAHGIRCSELTADEVRELEPSLALQVARGILFDDAAQVTDPRILTETLFAQFCKDGGEWRNENARAVTAVSDGVDVHVDAGEKIHASHAVIAAGAFSTRIDGVDALPLVSERGYHVQFAGRENLLQRPVHWAGSGFYACPVESGLRIAGTVEIDSRDAPPNQTTPAYLTRMAKRMFALEDSPQQTWLGFRPTLPDALPAIGASLHAPNILLAFGHHHLGLTLAGVTGRMIARHVAGARAEFDESPYSPSRFRR